ncbi:hypothetical protein AB0M20_27655 [Actinoplanes sp. NPDC051633]
MWIVHAFRLLATRRANIGQVAITRRWRWPTPTPALWFGLLEAGMKP